MDCLAHDFSRGYQVLCFCPFRLGWCSSPQTVTVSTRVCRYVKRVSALVAHPDQATKTDAFTDVIVKVFISLFLLVLLFLGLFFSLAGHLALVYSDTNEPCVDPGSARCGP